MRNQLIAASLAMACGSALADGAPLFTPGPALSRAEAASAPRSRSAAPVTINKYALDSNVITVDIEGKQYRFVGKQMPVSEEGTALWMGDAPEGKALLSRGPYGVTGSIDIGSRMFRIARANGKPVLIEVVQAEDRMEERTPQMIEAARKRRIGK